jgi:4,5-dihydroxyphthalate decarboxylase
MSRLQLDFACALYDRMQPIYTGEVPVDGIKLNFIPIELPRPIFDRMSGGAEFDVAEYSSSEFVQRYAAGKCDFVAIPVFPSRTFRHSFISVNRKSGIKKPKDLEGKRVGVALYTMTAAIFIRGLLQHEYGVDLDKIHWVQGAINEGGAHGSPTVLPLLKKVDLEINNSGKSLSDLLEAGEIDATIGTSLPEAIRYNPDIARMFPNFHEIEREYYQRTRIYPIMHLVVIKKRVYERHPFVATSLFSAFNRSKNIALERMKNLRALRYMLPWMAEQIDEIHDVFGGDPWPYGVEPNRPTLEALVTYLVDQGLVAAEKKPSLEELFVPIYG